MEDAANVEKDRYGFNEFITDEAKEYLADKWGYKMYAKKELSKAAEDKG